MMRRGVARQLARELDLLLVAARQRPRGLVRLGAAHVETARSARGAPPRLAGGEERATAELVEMADRHILPDAALQRQADAAAIGGNIGEPSLARGARRSRRARPPQISTSPATGRRSPAMHSTSSSWPLPCTPARPTISPPRTLSDKSVDRGFAAIAQRA